MHTTDQRSEAVAAQAAASDVFATDPAGYFRHSWHAMQHIDPAELAELQLAAAQLRFDDLRDRVPTLQTLADDQGITRIDAIEDVVPLLFQHSVYKSYPTALLVRNRFPQLTTWLDRLTAHDLSGVDVSACDSIDSWLDALDAQTPLRVAHSSGTTGTMSFYPRAAAEWDTMMAALKCGLYQYSDPLDERDHQGEYFELVWPLFRQGRAAITRFPDVALPHIMGSEDRIHALRPGRLSSDGMFLAGRLAAAEARGETDAVEINPALAGRRDEFIREQREMQQGLPNFVTTLAHQLQGRRIWLLGTFNTLYAMAQAALDAGLENLFAPDSLVTTGGGAKGVVVPDDWQQTVARFTGIEQLQKTYVMTETTAMNKLCEHERYHFEPWIVPFVLDPDDGRLLPRDRGEQTGRAAFLDLMARSHWGGIISGDEISLSHEPCACGRTSPHMADRVERYSDKRGGDDKITCAASDAAHTRALEFLTERL